VLDVPSFLYVLQWFFWVPRPQRQKAFPVNGGGKWGKRPLPARLGPYPRHGHPLAAKMVGVAPTTGSDLGTGPAQYPDHRKNPPALLSSATSGHPGFVRMENSRHLQLEHLAGVSEVYVCISQCHESDRIANTGRPRLALAPEKPQPSFIFHRPGAGTIDHTSMVSAHHLLCHFRETRPFLEPQAKVTIQPRSRFSRFFGGHKTQGPP